MRPAALGYVPHTGWAWEVLVATGPGAEVIARTRRIAVEPVEDAQLYHRAAELPAGDAAEWLAPVEVLAAEATESAIRSAVADAHALGFEVRRVAVVGKVGKEVSLARILASHAAIHGGEGELWRRLFAEAAARLDLAVCRVAEVALDPNDPFLAAGRVRVGPPWTAEPRAAAVAARDAP